MKRKVNINRPQISSEEIAKTKDFTNQCREIITACAYHKISHVYVEENFSATLANELRRVARDMKVMVQVIAKFRNKNKSNCRGSS